MIIIMDFHDPSWVCDKLGLDRNTVYGFLKDGTLPAIQLGRKWLISESGMARFLEEETARQTAARREASAGMARTLRKITYLSPSARNVLREGFGLARDLGYRRLGTDHLLIALLHADAPTIDRLLADHGLTNLRTLVPSQQTRAQPTSPARIARKLGVRRAMRIAQDEARQLKSPRVQPEHLFLGLLLSPARAIADRFPNPQEVATDLRARLTPNKETP